MKIPEEVLRIADDIRTMRTRGAGRIARAAASALKIAAEEFHGMDLGSFIKYMESIANLLVKTRPTAVSLPNAVNYVMRELRRNSYRSVSEAKNLVISRAELFINYSKEATRRIGEIGSKLIMDGDAVLTHCNSMAALSVIVEAWRRGKNIDVYATETRPKFQGHITIQILSQAGVEVTLIPDSAVRMLMKKMDKVIVGADTVTANGAVINKIGTSQIALAAKEHNVNFFVAAESFKFSPATVIGELVIIEERSPLEVVTEDYLRGNPRVRVRNPSFDVTPSSYIDAIITELGVIPPQAAILVLMEEYGHEIKDELLNATGDLEESEFIEPLGSI